eukprot:1686_1
MSVKIHCKICVLMEWMHERLLSDLRNNKKEIEAPETCLSNICYEIFDQPRFSNDFEYATNCDGYSCKKNNSDIICAKHVLSCNRHQYYDFARILTVSYVTRGNAFSVMDLITKTIFNNPYFCKIYCKSDNFRIFIDRLSELLSDFMFYYYWDTGDLNFWPPLAIQVSNIMDNIWIIAKYKRVVQHIVNESTLISAIANFIIKRLYYFQFKNSKWKLSHLPYFIYVIKSLLIFWMFIVKKSGYHFKLSDKLYQIFSVLELKYMRCKLNRLQREFCMYISIVRSLINVDIQNQCEFDEHYFNARAKYVYLQCKNKISCNYCQKHNKNKLCSGCKAVIYCSKSCQKKDWPDHKTTCNIFKEINSA